VFLALLLFVEKAYAYLDPGTGSILLQGLIAAVIGGLVSGRLYWQRIKSLALHLIEWVTFICRLPQDKDPNLQGGSRSHWQTALCYGSLCYAP